MSFSTYVKSDSISSLRIGSNQKCSLQWMNADQKSLETVFLDADWQQMAIKNSVSVDFLSMFVLSVNVFDCRLSSVIICAV